MTDTSRNEPTQNARSDEIPAEDLHGEFDDRQPETQGDSAVDAELGADGQGDILAEDEPAASGRDDGPDDLRVEDRP
jgi:hypothetical protein